MNITFVVCIFSLFIEAKSENRSLGDDKTRFRLYVAPVIGKKTVAELATNDIEKIKKKCYNKINLLTSIIQYGGKTDEKENNFVFIVSINGYVFNRLCNY